MCCWLSISISGSFSGWVDLEVRDSQLTLHTHNWASHGSLGCPLNLRGLIWGLVFRVISLLVFACGSTVTQLTSGELIPSCNRLVWNKHLDSSSKKHTSGVSTPFAYRVRKQTWIFSPRQRGIPRSQPGFWKPSLDHHEGEDISELYMGL